ncbi:Retrovirus-related Pol polyprotein from transposon opus [Thelohanellus kitauei]|uniref:Retrovirus-related Pol polyprotein from transposon opus n=1 Tax=Thelohanellus kitauei TaxID=669202 RepID=A0A0C2JWZ6_THEKT|nr:Retrovirus-related Pol polyprotein from transposon opus [Thelohanellus kitauei]
MADPIEQDYILKTALSAEGMFALYEFTTLLFAVNYVQTRCQRLIDIIWKDSKIALAHYDNLIVCSQDLRSHIKNLREILDLLEKVNFGVIKEKCASGKTEFQFFGHVETKNGVRSNMYRMKRIDRRDSLENRLDLSGVSGL